MTTYVKAAAAGEIPPGSAKLVELEGKRIALFNIDGEYHAISDVCTHRGGPLSEGFVEGDRVTCPWHGAQYDIKSGAVLRPPAPEGVQRFNVRVQGSDIEIEI